MRRTGFSHRPDSMSLEQFEVMAKLGKGGFSLVYLGTLG